MRKRIVILLTAAVLGVAALFFFFDPRQGGLYPICLFHKFTGLECPGCGSLRALHELTHGNFLAAFHCNPLLITLLPMMGYLGIRWLKGGRSRIASDVQLTGPAVAWTMLAVTVTFGVLRNLPWPAFAWMSP
jgi:hypothetical protein